MASDNKLYRAGDVDFGSVVVSTTTGIVHDITPQVLSIELTENLFEPFITGVITVNDAIDFVGIFPMIGNEIVEVNFITPTFNEQYRIKRQYVVCGISDRIPVADRSAVYQIRIISPEAIIDKNVRISKTFRGSCDQIAKSLVGVDGLNSTKPLINEGMSNSVTFISNWWTPTQCIDYLCRRALSLEGNPTMIFFETMYGLMLMSLETLVASAAVQTFRVSNYATEPTSNQQSSTTPNVERDYQSVLSINYHNGFNYFDRINQGYYGGEVIGYDCNTHQYVHSVAPGIGEQSTRLNQYKPTNDYQMYSSGGLVEYVPFITQNFEGEIRGASDSDIKQRIQRQQIFAQLGTSKATIQVYGRTDYTVGMVVNLDVPAPKQITEQTEQTSDVLVSGRYLVTSLKHVVTSSSHYCNLQLMKDSFIVDITKPTVGTVAKQ